MTMKTHQDLHAGKEIIEFETRIIIVSNLQ
jgi:hypothetical protein